MRRLQLTLALLLCGAIYSSATVQVNATLVSASGTPVPFAKLRFQLFGCGANIPQVPSAPASIVLKTIDFTPSQLPATIYGHDEITCGNSYSTLWHVTAFQDSNTPIAGDENYLLVAGTIWNLAGAQPFTGNLPSPGFQSLFQNPTQTQSIYQPTGTELAIQGTLDLTNATVEGFSAGLADPGSNGIIYRSGFNVTRAAVAADVVSLFAGASGTCFLAANGSCLPAGGTGTVTGIGFTGDGQVYSATPTTPITTSGSLMPSLLTHTANTHFAGPCSGSALAPTFRLMCMADLPSTYFYQNGTTFNIGATNTGSGGTAQSSPAISTDTSNNGSLAFNPTSTFNGDLISKLSTDLFTGPLLSEIANCSGGTALNKIAKLSTASANSCALLATATDITNLEGVVYRGNGTTGNAAIAKSGLVPCAFDGATTANDFVISSTSGSTPGNCHDAGASLPSAGTQVIGQVLSTNASPGTYVIRVASGGGNSGSGGGLSGLTTGFFPIATSSSTVGNGPIDYNITLTNGLSINAPAGLNLTASGTPLWQGASGACPTPATSNIFLAFCSGSAQISLGTAGFNAILTAAGISGAVINSGFVSQAFLDPTLATTYFQQTNGTGNTTATVTAAADVASAGVGVGLCTDANHNATTIACPAGSGAANQALSNVSSVTAFSSNFQFDGSHNTIATSTNNSLLLIPNGTGGVQVPAGTLANPGLVFAGDTAGNGFSQPSAGNFGYGTGGATFKFEFKQAAGFVLPNNLGFGYSSSTNASGSPDTCLNRGAAGTIYIGTACAPTNQSGSINLAALTASGQITSTLATGTAPLVIASTTTVPNLTASNHPKVQSCGTTSTCAATALTSVQIVIGSVPLVSGTPSTATITGISPAFTSSSSYVCSLTEATTATNNLLKVANVSGSSFTITGPATVTDVVNYQCIGT